MKNFFTVIFLSSFSFTAALAQETEPEDTIELLPVMIRGKIIDKPPYITSRVSDEALRRTDTRDVGEFLRNIPNVSGIRRGGTSIDPVVRGFKFSQLNVILSNGIKIENGCPNRMDPVSSHIEAEDIKNMEVIKGPFTLIYGPDFGGVINLVAHDPEPYGKPEIHGGALYGYETNWNGHKGHLSLSGGGRKVYFRVSGGVRDYGNYRSGTLGGRDTTFSSSFSKNNLRARLGYALGKNQRIMLSWDLSCSRNVMYPALTMDEKSDHTHIVSFDYSAKDLSKFIRALDLKMYRSGVRHIMDNSHRPSYEFMKMTAGVNASNTGGRIELDLETGKQQLITGVDYEYIFKDGKRTGIMEMMGTTSNRITSLWDHASVRNAGIFAQYTVPVSGFELMAAVRADFNQATSSDTLRLIRNDTPYYDDVNSSFINLSASAGITDVINDRTSLSLAVGRGTRSPNMLERFIKFLPVGYDNCDYLGNPKLEPETNYEADLTLRYNDESAGASHLNVFYSYVRNYITANLLPEAVATPQTQGVSGVKQFQNTRFVTFRGFELGYSSPIKYDPGGEFSAAFTYAVIPEETKYILTGSQITGETTVRNDALPEIPPLEATFSVHYRLFRGNFIPKITVRTVAGQHHTSGAFYEPATPGFALMHFSALCVLNKNMQVLAGMNNIFNRAYYEHLNRRIIGTTGKLYESGRIFYLNLSANF